MIRKPSNDWFRKFPIGFAGLGFLVAVLIWTYSEVSARSPHPANVQLWTLFVVLCPPSLLSIPFIDTEPGTFDFAIMWFVIGVVNAVLYGTIAWLLCRVALAVRKNRDHHSLPPKDMA